MKRFPYLLFFILLIIGFLSGYRVQAQCLTASYGQYPGTTFTPSCTGSPETISTACWAGEYSVVSVTSGVNYTFSSSVGSDYITISNATNIILDPATHLTK